MKRSLLTTVLFFLFASAYAYNFNHANEAISMLQQGDVQQCVDKLKKSVGINDLISQFYMAQCQEYGIGMAVDPANAFKMYRRAAERGLPNAMKELARCYRLGIGVEVSLAKAEEWENRFNNRKENVQLYDILELYNSAPAHQAVSQNQNSQSETPSKPDEKKAASTHSNRQNPVSSSHQLAAANQPKADAGNQKNIKSDVDIDIPVNKTGNPNLFALIIANENYQDVATVQNAINDGEVVALYCEKTLGLPKTNIHLVKDATLNNIKREINRLRQIADAFNGEASFLIYYAGHGIPDEKTRDAFLMPVDGFYTDITTCYSLAEFYETIASLPSKQNVIMLDACFSGSTRDGNMLMSARGVAIKPKTAAPAGKTVVLTSASGDETAFPYADQNHGLFTYYLLKNLKETKGNSTLGELATYIRDNVRKKSIIINGKSQTPTVSTSPEISNDWKNWKLK